MNIGKKIQELRHTRNLTQEQLAQDLGVSRQAVSKWESGKAIPDIENLMYISDLYNISLNELIKGDDTVAEKIIADAGAKKWHKLNILFFVTLLGYLVWMGFAHEIWHVGLAVATVGMIAVDTRILLRTRATSRHHAA